MNERILVVGHAAITCLGIDMDETWNGLITGQSGLKRHTALPPSRYMQDIAGLVEGFDEEMVSRHSPANRLEAKSIHLALHAAVSAWSDAGLNDKVLGRDRVAVTVGSAFGGHDLLDSEQSKAMERRFLGTSPFLIPGLVINQSAGQISQHLDLHGPTIAPANACASGGHAIAMAGMLLRSGEVDLAVCGGAESSFTPMIVNGFATMKALHRQKSGDRSSLDPALASRPFSVDRAGFVMSEGARMLVLATETTVRNLGLIPQAELVGWAMNSDGHHITMPLQRTIASCLRQALKRSKLQPSDIGYYNAHGTSTQVNDKVEADVIKEVFAEFATRLPVSSIKGAIGHSLGAASAIEAAVCVRCLVEQMVPPTINLMADPELDLDFIPSKGRATSLRYVMSASFGFGGTNNALVFGQPDLSRVLGAA